MKFTIRIDLRIVYALLVIAAALILVRIATAQTPTPRPNVPLLQTGGIFNAGCQPVAPYDTVVQACWVRTDTTEPVELGCVDSVGGAEARMDLNMVVNIGEVAEIRCYVVSDQGVPSDYSENAGIVDFTRPGRPYVK